jgi:hypothetical protein
MSVRDDVDEEIRSLQTFLWALISEACTKADRMDLASNASEKVTSDLWDIVAIFDYTRDVFQKRYTLAALKDLLYEVHLFGALGGMAEVNKEKKQEVLKRLARASYAKQTKSKRIDSVIKTLADPILKKHPAWSSNRVAGEIIGDLNKQLGLALKLDAARKRVKKYMDGCSKVR